MRHINKKESPAPREVTLLDNKCVWFVCFYRTDGFKRQLRVHVTDRPRIPSVKKNFAFESSGAVERLCNPSNGKREKKKKSATCFSSHFSTAQLKKSPQRHQKNSLNRFSFKLSCVLSDAETALWWTCRLCNAFRKLSLEPLIKMWKIHNVQSSLLVSDSPFPASQGTPQKKELPEIREVHCLLPLFRKYEPLCDVTKGRICPPRPLHRHPVFVSFQNSSKVHQNLCSFSRK